MPLSAMNARENSHDERSRTDDERDRALEQEHRARVQAETAAHAREEFLGALSHELRAPLNVIQSWAHVLEGHIKDTPSTPLVQKALRGIKIGVAQQVKLIENLQDATSLMRGRLRIVRQPITLLPNIVTAVESMREAAAAKEIRLVTKYSLAQEQMDGDEDRIQQIVWNLLSNAIKFTPEGGEIALTAAHADGLACITVHDNGIGISRESLPHIFDRFGQLDTPRVHSHSGLGIGLFVVRRLVELHGGCVRVESEGENRGATFSVFLPLRSH